MREVLAEHRCAIGKEIDRYVEMYIHWHPEGRNDGSARVFINRYKADCLKQISLITDEYINRTVAEEIEDKKDFLERIMIQEKQAMSEFAQRISTA